MSRAMVACLDLIVFMLASFYFHMLRGWKFELFFALGPLSELSFFGKCVWRNTFYHWIMPNLNARKTVYLL